MRFARVLLPFLAGGLLAGVVLELYRPGRERVAASPVSGTRTASSHAEPDAARTGADEALAVEIAALRREMRALEQRLASLVLEPRRPAESLAAPVDVSADLERFTAEVASLRAEIAASRAEEKDRFALLERARAEKPAADWTELQLLLDLWLGDEESARKEVQLSGEEQIVRRFGTPDLTFPTKNGVRWVYGQGYDPERDAYDLQIVLGFADGYVSELFVEGL